MRKALPLKGIINAVGSQDSLGRDRTQIIRGLENWGGRPVVEHTL